jgi:hypothetical protein
VLKHRALIGLGIAAALGLATLLIVLRLQASAVSTAQAQWAIRRVHTVVFAAFPLGNVGCFTLQPGRSQATVAVLDPSYTDYRIVQCDTRVSHAGQGYLVTFTQSWDDGRAPTDLGLLGWVKRLLYRPASHTWSYRVLPGGTVITLPEHGPAPPQSYYQ